MLFGSIAKWTDAYRPRITGGLTALDVKKYGGKIHQLRIEDTNSDNIDIEAYDMLPEDAE